MSSKGKEVQRVGDLKGNKRITPDDSIVSPTLPSKQRKRNGPHYNVGDCVLLMPSDPNDPPYVARVEESKANKVKIRWYYRPRDTDSWRKDFHGAKELFLSNHFDPQTLDCIIGKCTVHTFQEYMELEGRRSDSDYYCRYNYNASTKELTLDVNGDNGLCICEDPYNPDLYVQCYICKSRYHPACANAVAKSSCIICCDKCKNSPHQERAADKRFEKLLKLPRLYPGSC